MTVTYDYFPDIYLKFLITQLFLKIFPKYRKNFHKIACFKSFLKVPLNILRISEHMSISSEFRNTYKFPPNFLIPFFSIIPNVRKNFTSYFHRIVRPKIRLKFALKNFKYIFPRIISLCSIPSPPLHCSSSSPIIPSAMMVIHVHVSGEQGE